ncbi:NAD(P)-dependent oxidoreductase [Bifidobacterium margollesii]|uniref:NAD(P)-dependent oxidoreductase n=1 Tax=Bifidobacterium margollesii TaxID=2020964 RepID=A0A2N5JBV3_9BIFI|nr:SDR family oxidoreductase [Bifidobacterium margollesii]PLS31693.1 NAD(P)-dependent oxidoreductase [Bifidobacterium margollesii]
MSIVITAASGHFGHLAVNALLDKGVDPQTIVAAARTVEKVEDLAAKGVRTAKIDYDDPSSLRKAFEGANRVLLISGNEFGKRTAQHRNVIEAAKAEGVELLAYTSVLDADRSPLFVAPEHRETEAILRDSGVPAVILRNGWYTENYVDVVRQGIATGRIVSAANDGKVASASRADYAEAAAQVLVGEGHAGKTYEFSGDEAWTYDDLAAVAARIGGKDVEYVNLTPDELRTTLTEAGVPEGGVAYEVQTAIDTANGALALQTGDLARVLGHPTTSLETVLRRELGE